MNIRRDDEKPSMGRLHENDDAVRAGRAIFGGRIGRVGGRPTQTFHCTFTPVKRNQEGRAGEAVDYLAREGDYHREADEQDLEYLAGDTATVNAAVMQIHNTARRRDERVMLTMVTELPPESTPLARALVAERLVEYWQSKGHEAVAAVHAPPPKPDGRLNFHIHLAFTSRPVARDGDGGWRVNYSPEARPLKNRAAVKSERAAVARIVNETMAQQGITCPVFHPGNLKDVGIQRRAKKRVPQARYLRGQQDIDPQAQAEARSRYLLSEKEAANRRAERERRRGQRMTLAGLAPVGELDRVRTQRDQMRRQVMELERQPPQLVEIVKQVPVPVELPEDQKPATARQVETLLAMAHERGMQIDEEVPMTVGTVGATIRHLMTVPRLGQQQPAPAGSTVSAPSVTDGDCKKAQPSATDAPRHPPFLVDPAEREGGKQKARLLTNNQVLDGLTATRSEMTQRYQAGDQVGRLFAKTGAEILEAEGIRRGLIEIRTRSSRNQLERD